MSQNKIIEVACYRSGSNWPSETSADLATAIVETAALEPMTWFGFRTESISNGGDRAELAKLYGTGGFFNLLKQALAIGDWSAIQDLKDDAGDVVTLSAATKQAIAQTLANHKLRLVDLVAAETKEVAPEEITAAMVDEALGRA